MLSKAGAGRSRRYDQGIWLFDQGLHGPAIAEFQAALIEENPDPMTERLARFYLAEAHSALALAWLAEHDGTPAEDRVIASLREAIHLSPNYADLQFHLGSAHLSRGEFSEASDAFMQALAINPGYAKATLALGIAFYAQGRYDEGLSRSQFSLSLDPTFRRTAFNEAQSAHAAGRLAEAESALRRMSDTEGGEDSQFHARLALDLFRRGMFAEAADEYRLAVTINPQYADLRNQLGAALLELGQEEAARAEFDQALAINPGYAEARLNLGRTLVRLNRREEALAAFETVLEQDPASAAAQEAIVSLEETAPGL